MEDIKNATTHQAREEILRPSGGTKVKIVGVGEGGEGEEHSTM